MLCEKCNQNKANIKYSQVLNGIKIDYNLCEKCFNHINYTNSFFNSFLYSHNIDCNICGNTFENFKHTGKMGCCNCYNIFKEKLNPIFNNMQQKNIHTGKSPKNLKTYKPNVDTIQILKEKLNIAVKNEDYEEAIKIRDKIKAIERGDI